MEYEMQYEMQHDMMAINTIENPKIDHKYKYNIIKDIPYALTKGGEDEDVCIWERETEEILNDKSVPIRQRYNIIIADLAFLCNRQPVVYEKVYNAYKPLIDWMRT
jgi:hypothetical protein